MNLRELLPFGLAVITALAFLAASVLSAQREAERRRQDIEVLRVAVFNHLRHGSDPREQHIREVLGYGDRE